MEYVWARIRIIFQFLKKVTQGGGGGGMGKGGEKCIGCKKGVWGEERGRKREGWERLKKGMVANLKKTWKLQLGVSQLTILETCKEDSANWTIRASNSAGYAESHAKLLVQVKNHLKIFSLLK